MKSLHMVAFILLVIGGLNWLLVGLFGVDIGALFGGMDALISRLIYVLVGLAAIYEAVMHKQNCKYCAMGATSTPSSTTP
jgi:hypothetical protein